MNNHHDSGAASKNDSQKLGFSKKTRILVLPPLSTID
jgi:hypothetical protein